MGFNGNRCKFYFDSNDAKEDRDTSIDSSSKVPF